ncbi:MAG: AAA family ATPase [Ferruginibacter sp.]
MSETLTIRNFGPIKDMTFEFKKINVLIGDQGTGKSTVAKILSAIKNCFFREIFNLPEEEGIDKQTQQFNEHLNLVGIKNFLKKESFLFYKCPDYYFELKKGEVSINKNIDTSELKMKSMYYDFNYILAERNMVHVLADSLYALLELKAELPKLFTRFGNKYITSRKSKSEFNYTDILGVKFIHKDNKDYILIPDGIEISLSDASSGIQGCVALLTVFDSITSVSFPSGRTQYLLMDKNLRLLVIEEPELNCFPSTQYRLMKYIIENNKISSLVPVILENDDPENPDIDIFEDYENEVKNQLVITTHSPYILTSLNNLMYAYKVGQENSEEVETIIEKKYWLNPDDVSVYRLSDGHCENIMDEELKQIKVEKIDEISEVLSAQWHKLADLNFNKQE